jgi:hypothetical protein
MPNQSRKVRGRKTEHVVAAYFQQYWEAARAVNSGASGSDILGIPFDCEVKARAKFDPLSYIKQLKNRTDGRLGFAVMRCNGQGDSIESVADYVFIARLGDMMPLLEDKVPSDDIARCKGCGSWTIVSRACAVCALMHNE